MKIVQRRDRGFFTLPAGLGILKPAQDLYRYWRIYITANDGDSQYTSLDSMELFDTGAVGDGGSGHLDNYATAQANYSESSFDSSNSTAWEMRPVNNGLEWVTASGQHVPAWAAFDFGSPRKVTRYYLKSQRVVTGRTPTSWQIQGNNTSAAAGAPWVTVSSVSGSTGWSVLETRHFGV
ncbi:MAG: hypothetical protein ACRCYZ_06825 [Alphaproteobacteria bacterium]